MSTSAKIFKYAENFMATTYARPPIVIARGQGSKLWDSSGKEYLDFTSGIAVTALGHSNPEVSKILSEQSSTLVHCSNLFLNEWTPRLSEELVRKTKESGTMPEAHRVFVCNSGSESNEAAIKFARKMGLLQSESKNHFVAFKGGFHGRTYGALTATCNPKYQAPFGPMVPGFSYGTLNDPSALDLITADTCGVIVEPIQGEGGVNPASSQWLHDVRQRCDEVGACLIFDEIQCGLGRSGDLWAHKASGVSPDILSMAKALGNGFPIGATLISEKVNDALQVGDHGTTYGGNPLASRVACYVLDQISSPALLKNVRERSNQILQRAESWKNNIEAVTDFRGRGLLLGIQLNQNPAPILEEARKNGLLLITCGTNTLRLVPALTVSEAEVEKGLDILELALKSVE